MKTMPVMLLMTMALVACQDQPTRDVQYYLDHPDERTAMLKECQNNPGEKAKSANCINAGEARHKALFRGTEMPRIRP